GVAVEPIRTRDLTAYTPDQALSVSVTARYRLRADGATPLLVAPNGDWVALRMPYRQGSLVVLATPQPLANSGLDATDGQTARFVFREILPQAAAGGSVAFDEVHHSFAPPTAAPTTMNQLLFKT